MLQARLFAFDPSLRRMRQANFHIGQSGPVGSEPIDLWLEAQFEFAALKVQLEKPSDDTRSFCASAVESADAVPCVRRRLEARLDEDGGIDEQLHFVVQVDEYGAPVRKVPVSCHDRSQIQVHYLPARRDPTDHISYAAN